MTAFPVSYLSPKTQTSPITQNGPSLSHLLGNASGSSSTSTSFAAIIGDTSEPATRVASTSLVKLREEYVCGSKLVEYIDASNFERATALLKSKPHLAAYRTTEGVSLLEITYMNVIEVLGEKDVFLPQDSLDFIYLLIHYHKPLMNEFISTLSNDDNGIDFRPIYIDLIEKQIISPTNLLVEMIVRGSKYFMGGYYDRRYKYCDISKNTRILAEIVINRMKSVDIPTMHRQLKIRCEEYSRENMEHLNKLLGIEEQNLPSEFVSQGCIIQ